MEVPVFENLLKCEVEIWEKSPYYVCKRKPEEMRSLDGDLHNIRV